MSSFNNCSFALIFNITLFMTTSPLKDCQLMLDLPCWRSASLKPEELLKKGCDTSKPPLQSLSWIRIIAIISGIKRLRKVFQTYNSARSDIQHLIPFYCQMFYLVLPQLPLNFLQITNYRLRIKN